jgi:molybdopterin-binding protein
VPPPRAVSARPNRGGQVVTSAITNEAVDDLGLKASSQVKVVIKASDVMIAVD